MRQRILVGMTFLLLAALTSFGLSQTTFTIYWNSNHVYDIYQEVFDQFAADHDLTLDVQTFAWPDMRTKLLTDFSAGDVPAFLEVPAPWIAEFGAMGLLQDITDEVAAWDESPDWFETAWEEVSVGDSIYGAKLHHTAFALFYNKDHFEAAGLDPEAPPTTLVELRDTARAVTEALGPGVLGFGFDSDPQYIMPFLASRETPRLIADGEIAIDTPAIRETLTILQEIARNDWALLPEPGASYQATRRSFMEGRIAMMLSGPWDIANLADVAPEMDYGIAIVPHHQDTEPMTLAAGTAVAIPNGTDQADLAWDLLQRITAVDVEVAATLATGMMMPRKSWASDARIQDVRGVQEFAPVLAMATPFDLDAKQLGLADITWGGDIFQQLYQSIVYSRGDVGQALDRYVRDAQQQIDRAQP